ncbi:MAG: extracellular solute-binding protein [Propionibacteriaceae bacterium]|jgi:N,N'-diacetylchitobiose transport system substrate-binding protein|nr:extracellular solute-binding protein [Propionibacteriaceae bacterium]
MKRTAALLAMVTSGALLFSACGSPSNAGNSAAPSNSSSESAAAGQNITLWLAGSDTPTALREYLQETYKKKTGGTLKIEEQTWGDLVTKLTTALPDPNNTPDVVEVGNTQSPTFTNVGGFSDITDMYQELGGDKLLQSFVEVGKVGDKNYTLPYYYGSRYMFYRKDIYKEAGVSVPKTLDEFNSTVVEIAKKNPKKIDNFSGFFIGGQDWRNGISWIFANGGDLAKQENGKWVSTMSDPNTIKGLTQLQNIYQNASKAPATAKDQSPWLYINDTDTDVEKDATTEEVTKETPTKLGAATIMAPGWAHWSIGKLTKVKDEKTGKMKDAREWDGKVFGVYPLPGNDGNPAPVFAGGSNIGISAKSKNQEGSRELLRIIFSDEYQTLLGENGMGPANSDFNSTLGSDEFAKALIDSASNSKLTPAAVGWAQVEDKKLLEELFSKISTGGDIAALTKEYDAKVTPILNGEG